MLKVYTSTHFEGVAMIQCFTKNIQVRVKYSNVAGHNIRVRLGSEEVKIAASLYGQTAR